MGFWKGLGKLAAGATLLTGKAAIGTAKLAAKGTMATGKVLYNNREVIASGTAKVAKVSAATIGTVGYGAYKATEWSVKKVVEHRAEIGGAIVGTAKGVGGAVADASAHAYAREDAVKPLIERIAAQSAEYKDQVLRIYGRIDAATPTVTSRQAVLDTLVVGGNTLAAYADSAVRVPPDVEKAFELAYPGLASQGDLAHAVHSMSTGQLQGFADGVKGKLLEIEYTDYLNDGNLPAGYHAELAKSATQPGWDISVTGPDGHIKDLIQAKATDSVSYVKDALHKYPHFDVVTTDEVHSHLVMQGFADHVIDSGISNAALNEAVSGALDGAVVHFSWMPSALSLALIAFSAYSQEGLSAYEKSKNFGDRSSRSYLAYLAGGALAVATNTWWIGVLGGMGTRLVMGAGRAKRQRLNSLQGLVRSNEQVLRRLRAMPG